MDELTNIQEFLHQTHPQKWDSDGDTLPDVWEIRYGLDPLWNNTTRLVLTLGWKYDTIDESGSSQAGYGDLDKDQLLDIDEFQYNLSNAETYNATEDGVFWNGTSPTDPDSDGDGLLDGLNRTIAKTDELFQKWVTKNLQYGENGNGTVTFVGETDMGTDCLLADTDGDGSSDAQEIYGYTVIITWYEEGELMSEEKTVFGDPLQKYMQPDGITPLDVDGDTIPDADEIDPWNSTKYAYYVNHSDMNETEVGDQFNPFVREQTPPKLLSLTIKTEEKWEWIVIGILPAYVCTHAWTEISVEVMDVANFTLEVRIDDYNNRFATFQGNGYHWFETALDLDYFTDVLLDYTIKISAEDANGNKLDPPLTKTVEGFFGGILNALSDFWDWLVGVAQAIGKAILDAINFILDVILGTITAILDLALKPILDAMASWASDVVGGFMTLIEQQGKDNYTEGALSGLSSTVFGGSLFYVLVGVATALSIVVLFATPFLSVFSILLGILSPLLIDLLTALLGATMGSDILLSPVQSASGLMAAYDVGVTLWNTPNIVLETLNLLFWLFSLLVTKTSVLLAIGEALPFIYQSIGLIFAIVGLGLSLGYFGSDTDESLVATTIGVFLSIAGLFFTILGQSSIVLWNYICIGVAYGSLLVSTIQAIFLLGS